MTDNEEDVDTRPDPPEGQPPLPGERGYGYHETYFRDAGLIIQEERFQRGFSAEQAAKKAKVAYKTWLRIESGKPVRPLTWNGVDRLFGLAPGTARNIESVDELKEALGRSRQEPLPGMGAPEDDLDEDEAKHVEPVARLFHEHHRRGRLAVADKTLIVQAVSRLTPFLDDPRMKAALRGLAPLAFAGITNDWDIYDSDGNFKIPPSAEFRDRRILGDANGEH